MARGAVMVEIILNVVRIGNAVIIALMARPAIRRRSGESSGVARQTRCRDMRPRQGKLRVGVIERGWLPGGRTVARGAIMIEIILNMVRIGGPFEIGLMAGVTFSRRALVTCRVARIARSRRVRPA